MKRRHEIQPASRPALSHSADAVFDDLGEILAAGGCTFGDVAMLTVHVPDIRDAPRVQVQQQVPGEVRSAGALVGVSCLAVPGASIEVDAVGVVR